MRGRLDRMCHQRRRGQLAHHPEGEFALHMVRGLAGQRLHISETSTDTRTRPRCGLGHSSQSQANTMMTAGTPDRPDTGWATQVAQRCDVAAMQLDYGLDTLSGPYADCLDDISGSGSDGLVTLHALSWLSQSVCAGVSVTIQGRLSTAQLASYQNLSNLNVAARTVKIDRKLSTASTWTLGVHTVTTGTGSTGYNWSRSLTMSPTSSTTYDYRARFDGAQGLEDGTSATFSVEWRAPICAESGES
jgi:hypothetical protein